MTANDHRPRILLLGSGTAFNTDGRASQSILVEPSELAPFLIDVGPTAMVELERNGIDPDRIDRLFLTHLHGDHIAGWPFLLLHLVFRKRRTRPFDVHGPAGTEQTLARLVDACFGELGEHRAFELRFHELEVREHTDVRLAEELSVDAIPVEHHPSSLGLRFRLEGRSFAVTGDTRWCEGVVRLASGIDLLVVECSDVSHQVGAHVSLDQLRTHRHRLDCPQVLLVHLTDAVASALALDPLPGVTAGHDGLGFPL